MTVQSAASRNAYIASGGATFFYTFLCLNSTDLSVYDNSVLQPTSAYMVTGVGAPAGGSVVFTIAPTIGHTIVILSNASYTQGVDLVNNDPFNADTVEGAFDRNTILAKQLKEITDRAPLFDEFSCDSGVHIDHPVPGFFLVWDGSGLRIASAQAVTVGGTLAVPVFTVGSIVFASGSAALSQDNANLFWDDTNNRLGLGTATPAHGVDAKLVGTIVIPVSGGQDNLIDAFFHATPAARTDGIQSIALAAYTPGVATGSVSRGRIAILGAAETSGGGGGGAPIWGGNLIVQQNLADNKAQAIGLELAFNNLKGNDALDPADCNHYGMTIDAYGGFSIGPAALAIRLAGAASTWQRGVWIPVSSITSGGYAFDYGGNGASGVVRITADSVVTADRFTTNTLAGTPAVNSIYAEGAAKAWVVFDGSASNPITPVQSFNVTAPVFKHATGNYTINWNRDFSCSRYAITGMAKRDDIATVGANIELFSCATAMTVSEVHITTTNAGGGLADCNIICVAAYGPQ